MSLRTISPKRRGTTAIGASPPPNRRRKIGIYGFADIPNPQMDGAYHRSCIVSELHNFDRVIVCRPLANSWSGDRPTTADQSLPDIQWRRARAGMIDLGSTAQRVANERGA